MKNTKCPIKGNACRDYGYCEDCTWSKTIQRYEKKIKNLTARNTTLKRGYQNLNQKLEECKQELTEVQHDYDMELAEHSEYIRGITERVLIGHANVRKETAKDFAKKIKETIFDYLGVKSIEEANKLSLIDSTLTYDIIIDKIDELLKGYGIEE